MTTTTTARRHLLNSSSQYASILVVSLRHRRPRATASPLRASAP